MKESIKRAKGSPYRDAYKYWHKNSNLAPKNAYGIDVDFVPASFRDNTVGPIIDFKRPGDSVTKTESKVYDDFNELGLAVYILTFHANFHTKKFTSDDSEYSTHERIFFTDEDINLIVVVDWESGEKEKLKSAEEYWQWEKK